MTHNDSTTLTDRQQYWLNHIAPASPRARPPSIMLARTASTSNPCIQPGRNLRGKAGSCVRRTPFSKAQVVNDSRLSIVSGRFGCPKSICVGIHRLPQRVSMAWPYWWKLP